MRGPDSLESGGDDRDEPRTAASRRERQEVSRRARGDEVGPSVVLHASEILEPPEDAIARGPAEDSLQRALDAFDAGRGPAAENDGDLDGVVIVHVWAQTRA